MIKQKINSKEAIECCCECGKFSVQRVDVSRIDIKYRHDGFILAPDLLGRILCRKCFNLQIDNLFNELQEHTSSKGKDTEGEA